MLLMAIYCNKNNLGGDAIQQLLDIFSYVLPDNNKVCNSLHAFKSYFNCLKNPLQYHHYCPVCKSAVEKKEVKQCRNQKCLTDFSDRELPYFLHVPVINQIRSFFSHAGFYMSLQGRFTKQRIGQLKDVYDGYLYQNMCKDNGPLSKPENVSFLLNTDGAPVFKSSKFSIWPIFLSINELDFKLRNLPQNMILSGLWFGADKPEMNTFLEPLLEEFKNFGKGVECFSPDRGTFICKGYLLGVTADLPARALLCNSVQFNGSFGCWKCLQEGRTAARGQGHTHAFPFNAENPKGPKRTTEQALQDADSVILSGKKGEKINGIKGLSWLSLFPKFDFVEGITIDYMHGVLLGVQKRLLNLWFSKEFSKKTFSISSHVSTVDNGLLQIHPTLDVSRLPRSISLELKYWKASEFQNFLLFYGLPLLKDVIDEERWLHYSLFVSAIFILLQDGITENDLKKAEKMIEEFCRRFEELYDICFMTLNVHQLLHLVENVRNFGPLYTHSCFPFEDKNGKLLKMIRGTQNVDQQIIKGVSFLQKLPELRNSCIPSGSYILSLCESIECPQLLKRGEQIEPGIYILGGLLYRELNQAEVNAYETYFGYASIPSKYKLFTRIELKGQIIYGTQYKRMKNRDNSTICYKDSDGCVKYGKVCFFLFENISNELLAFLSPLKPAINEFKVQHIVPVMATRAMKCIPVSNILFLCLTVSFDDKICVCKQPNTMLKV